jgi:ribonuclease P protein component
MRGAATPSCFVPVAESGIRVRLQLVTFVSGAFPKSRRLLRHADFQRVYEGGRRQFTGNMTMFFLRRTVSVAEAAVGDSLRVGFTVGKALGGAVERNRLKRRMREAVRTSWPAEEAPMDVVIHPRRSVLEIPFADVASEVARGLQLALQRAREAQPEERSTRAGQK